MQSPAKIYSLVLRTALSKSAALNLRMRSVLVLGKDAGMFAGLPRQESNAFKRSWAFSKPLAMLVSA